MGTSQSRRTLMKGGAWAIPAVALAASAPALAASVATWQLVLSPLDQTCGPGRYGNATTHSGFSLTNIVDPVTGTATGTIVVDLSVLIYTTLTYATQTEANSALQAATSAFESSPPAVTSDVINYLSQPWQQTDYQTFDFGDGSWSGTSTYHTRLTLPSGLAPGSAATFQLTISDLPGDVQTIGTVQLVTPIDSNGMSGDAVQLWDSSVCGIVPA